MNKTNKETNDNSHQLVVEGLSSSTASFYQSLQPRKKDQNYWFGEKEAKEEKKAA